MEVQHLSGLFIKTSYLSCRFSSFPRIFPEYILNFLTFYFNFFFLIYMFQEEYEVDDEMGKLNCGHFYHINCIKQWLVQKNACPICKTEVLSQQ